MSEDERRTTASHVFAELGLVVHADGEELRGTAPVNAMMHVPDTGALRISILATWADTVLGLLAVRAIAPRVPVTLELDVHLTEPVELLGDVVAVGRVTKSGANVVASTIEFRDADGRRFGFGHSMFMTNPDPRQRMPSGDWALERMSRRWATLTQPFADRVGCRRLEPGSASLPLTPEVSNQSRTLNGGLLALVVEEAVLSAEPAGRSLASMTLRYLRPVRTGPAVARADVQDGLADIGVVDEGSGALAVLATTRSFAW